MSGRTGRIFLQGAAAVCALLLLASGGCFGTRGGDVPPPEPERKPASGNGAPAASQAIPPAIPIADEPAPSPKEEPPAAKAEPPSAIGEPPAAKAEPPSASPAPGPADREQPKAVPALPEKTRSAGPAAGTPVASPSRKPRTAPTPEPAAKPPSVAPVRPEGPPVPPWATRKEALSYRVDFLGITMGYAWFQYNGKASVGGRTAYHIKARAWTSGILSYLYPINETIDYYLDTGTSEPIRIEYTGRKGKRDDVALYDQENGKIVYRYRDTGEIRKTVDVVPSIHDPVSAVYYFRWRDMGKEDRPRNVYGGRKVYQIAARLAGTERLETEGGPVDTLVIEPVIRREGKLENKGNLKMWATADERRVPVRFFAKFRKVKEWTLIGELMPERPGG